MSLQDTNEVQNNIPKTIILLNYHVIKKDIENCAQMTRRHCKDVSKSIFSETDRIMSIRQIFFVKDRKM